MVRALSSTPLLGLNATVLDTETTGLDPFNDRVIQIGAVQIVKARIAQDANYERLVKPDISIPVSSSEIHGITEKMVEDALPFKEVIKNDEKCLFDHGVIIGHNIFFDLQILAQEYRRNALSWSPPRALCTALLARAVSPSLNDYSLDNLCDLMGVTVKNRHTALGDAIVTAELFLKLIPGLTQKNIRTLAEAEAVCIGFSSTEASKVGGQQLGWMPELSATPRSSLAQVDVFSFSHRVSEIMSSPVRSVEQSADLQAIGKVLSDEGISSVLVSPKDPLDPWGIITERDVMRLVVAQPIDSSLMASDIMSSPLVTIEKEAFVYRALSVMADKNVRHLGVVDKEGEVIGALSTGDLLRQRANDALILGDKIDTADSKEDLAELWARVPYVAANMLRDGVGVRPIAAFIAEETCALTKRAFQLAEAEMLARDRGEPPCAYSVLVLGSGGRGETLLAPDQDNAIVYRSDGNGTRCDEWFQELSTLAAKTLDMVGLPFCKGGVMAKNSVWRHSLEGWQQTINSWADRAQSDDLLNVDIFYDFRSVHGDDRLARELRSFAIDVAKNSPPLLRKMALQAADSDPVIGLFGRIITEQGRVDVKKGGLLALVSCARILALANGIDDVRTESRFESFRQLKIANDEDIENASLAHEIVLREALRQQLDDIEAGVSATYNVEIKRLSKKRRDSLKWALGHAEIVKHLTRDVMT